MITHSDDDPDFGPDDPLAVIMRPPAEYLSPPPGRYEAIRRGAAAALGMIGPAAAEAVLALITALGDAVWNVRGSAARTLMKIGPAAGRYS